MKTKADFRRYIRQEKKKYAPEELMVRSGAIWEKVEEIPEFQQSSHIAVYWSLPDEVYSHAFVEKWCSEKHILLPVMCNGYDLELRPYRAGCVMKEADFCIREPEGDPVDLRHVGLILVPGMAFDRENHRLGRGKGYYDRLLCRMKAVKAGICFDFQLLEELPVDPYDILMDKVIAG